MSNSTVSFHPFTMPSRLRVLSIDLSWKSPSTWEDTTSELLLWIPLRDSSEDKKSETPGFQFRCPLDKDVSAES